MIENYVADIMRSRPATEGETDFVQTWKSMKKKYSQM